MIYLHDIIQKCISESLNLKVVAMIYLYDLVQKCIILTGQAKCASTVFDFKQLIKTFGYLFQSGSHRHDCNPGGSADISLYYKPSMTSDPWSKTQPVSSQQSQSPLSSSLSGDTDQSNTESS